MSKAYDELFGLKSSRTGEYLHSKSADEMFEELGYVKDIEVNYGLIRYNKDDKYYIRFIIEDEIVESNSLVDNEVWISRIDMKLLQAINKKVKELGWLDE